VLASAIQRAVVAVTIHDAPKRGQNFGQVGDAYIAIYNEETGSQLFRYDLAEDYSTETAMLFGEIYRHNGEWKFTAIGQGYSGGLKAICAQFGVDAED
jgi:tellurium resistance protein TerD